MALVTETQETTTSPGANYFTFAGSGWGSQSDAAASGGTMQKTNTPGDSVTINWTGRSLYLMTATFYANAANFGVVTDGASIGGNFSCSGPTTNGVAQYRYPIALARNLADGPHVTTLTLGSGSGATLWVDSILSVSGNRVAAAPGILVCCGDSWTVGSGSSMSRNAYANQLSSQLEFACKASVTLVNAGTNGSKLTNNGGINSNPAIYQIISNVLSSGAQWLTLLFGTNDLRQGSGGSGLPIGEYVSVYRTTLSFIEDVLDTSSIRVFVGTPGTISPAYSASYLENGGATAGILPAGLQAWEQSGAALAVLLNNEFPWATLVDVYGAMGRRTELVLPNAVPDLGLHPNDDGHSVIACAFATAIAARH